MPTITNKQRILTQMLTALKSRYAPAEPDARSVFEQFVYAICREGVTREQADRAMRNLRDRFFDWNEVRVSSLREVQEAFAELPHAEARAQRLLSFLQEVFEATFSFDLEPLVKKGLKQAAKQLARYQAANTFAVAWVVQHSLGGHAIAIDAPSRRVLTRLRLLEDDASDPEAIRASLEHLVPKLRGGLFGELVSELAGELCTETSPNCPACPLAGECPSVAETSRASALRGHRSKPR